MSQPELLLVAEGLVQTASPAGGPRVLDGTSLGLPSGLTALVGPNGVGKSTLMRTLAGVRPPRAGTIAVRGAAQPPAGCRREVAYVPQFPGAYPDLSPLEALRRLHHWLGGKAGRSPQAALVRFGLATVADLPGRRLDPGARRRLALAGAWLRGCAVILLDEPTADLDPLGRATFWSLVAQAFGEEEALLATTHLLDEVDAYARHVVHLSAGGQVWSGSVAELRALAAGRTFLAREGPLPAGFVPVGMAAPDRAQVLWTGEGPPPDEGFAPRPPTALDGYLVRTAAEGVAGVGP